MENHRRRPRSESAPVPSHCPPGWTWLLAGILIGMFISFLFYLREITPPQPLVDPPPTPLTGGGAPFLSEPPFKPQEGERASVVQDSSSSSVATKKFEFFDTLPNMEVKVPEDSSAHLTDNLPVTVPGKYILQVGSFRDKQQADGLVSHLSTFGIQAQVKQVVDNNDEWYRVHIGPFTDLDELNQTRSKLSENGIPTILLKF